MKEGRKKEESSRARSPLAGQDGLDTAGELYTVEGAVRHNSYTEIRIR